MKNFYVLTVEDIANLIQVREIAKFDDNKYFVTNLTYLIEKAKKVIPFTESEVLEAVSYIRENPRNYRPGYLTKVC